MPPSKPTSLPKWPPEVTEAHLETLTLLATTFALSHGLLYLPVSSSSPSSSAAPAPVLATPPKFTTHTPAPTSAIHAPLTIFPTPFPRRLFTHAQHLQRAYNVLYARIAMDWTFLDTVMGEIEGVGRVDEFVGQLWRGWRAVREAEGASTQVGTRRTGYAVRTDADV